LIAGPSGTLMKGSVTSDSRFVESDACRWSVGVSVCEDWRAVPGTMCVCAQGVFVPEGPSAHSARSGAGPQLGLGSPLIWGTSRSRSREDDESRGSCHHGPEGACQCPFQVGRTDWAGLAASLRGLWPLPPAGLDTVLAGGIGFAYWSRSFRAAKPAPRPKRKGSASSDSPQFS